MSLFGTRSRRVVGVAVAGGMWVAAAVIISVAPGQPAVFALLLGGGLVVLLAALISQDSVGVVDAGLYRDVLKDDLHMDELGELGGVQYASLPFPDRGSIGDPMVLLFLVQNAYTESRVFRLGLGRGVLEADAPHAEVELAGGECGVLVIAVHAKQGTQPGEYAIRFRPHVKKPRKAGARISPARKLNLAVGARQFQAIHTVTDGSTSRPAVALPPSGYRVLFRPGMPAPDTSPLAFLNAPAG